MNSSEDFNAIEKAKEIFSAWGVMFNPSDAQSALAKERIQVCNACEDKREMPFIHCGVCKCPLKSKVFSSVKGGCPSGKWNEIDQKFLKTNQ